MTVTLIHSQKFVTMDQVMECQGFAEQTVLDMIVRYVLHIGIQIFR